MSMSSLKPCPFCGTPDPLLLHSDDTDSWRVLCTWCGASSAERGTEEKALDAWNRRWAQ